MKSSKKRIYYSDDDDDEAPDEDLECLSYNRSCQQQLLSESFYFDGLVMARVRLDDGVHAWRRLL